MYISWAPDGPTVPQAIAVDLTIAVQEHRHRSSTTSDMTANLPAQLDDELKATVSHDEKGMSRPRTEAEQWLDGLSDDEFAAEQKKLLRKVS